MLPTKLIKKGCIISFISLLLLAAVLYFVVYKTLVLESFEAPDTREWGRTVLNAGQMSDVPGTVGNKPAFEAALKFGKESIDDTVCGNNEKSYLTERTCTSIENKTDCDATMRVKKKIKGRGDHIGMVDDAFDDAGLTGTGVGYDLNGMKNDIDYKLNYNVYPCKWVEGGGPDPGEGLGAGAGLGECTNDLHNRCVFMGERDPNENPDGWYAGMEKTNKDGSQSYTYSDIVKVIDCAESGGGPGCPEDNNQA